MAVTKRGLIIQIHGEPPVDNLVNWVHLATDYNTQEIHQYHTSHRWGRGGVLTLSFTEVTNTWQYNSHFSRGKRCVNTAGNTTTMYTLHFTSISYSWTIWRVLTVPDNNIIYFWAEKCSGEFTFRIEQYTAEAQVTLASFDTALTFGLFIVGRRKLVSQRQPGKGIHD